MDNVAAVLILERLDQTKQELLVAPPEPDPMWLREFCSAGPPQGHWYIASEGIYTVPGYSVANTVGKFAYRTFRAVRGRQGTSQGSTKPARLARRRHPCKIPLPHTEIQEPAPPPRFREERPIVSHWRHAPTVLASPATICGIEPGNP